MSTKYENIRKAALKDVAKFMCVAARTAPKTRGQDHLIVIILTKTEKQKVITQMKKIAKRDNRPSCKRDAINIENSDNIVIIATKKVTLGLNCGFCGYTSCQALSKTKGICAYNSMDLGIALGSAVSIAAKFHVDNRLMFSVGKAVLELDILGKKAVQAIGIPLSATGKNPFFDRG
ncbi:MAG: ferredoxin [Candidatus Omnitrophica bacterium]|nr:ferredoxin [Candidatus Omnitrophota bacterium]